MTSIDSDKDRKLSQDPRCDKPSKYFSESFSSHSDVPSSDNSFERDSVSEGSEVELQSRAFCLRESSVGGESGGEGRNQDGETRQSFCRGLLEQGQGQGGREQLLEELREVQGRWMKRQSSVEVKPLRKYTYVVINQTQSENTESKEENKNPGRKSTYTISSPTQSDNKPNIQTENSKTKEAYKMNVVPARSQVQRQYPISQKVTSLNTMQLSEDSSEEEEEEGARFVRNGFGRMSTISTKSVGGPENFKAVEEITISRSVKRIPTQRLYIFISNLTVFV